MDSDQQALIVAEYRIEMRYQAVDAWATGVELVADGADKYLSTLQQVASAEQKLASAADPAVAAINQLDDQAGAAAKGLDKLGDEAQQTGKGMSTLDNIVTGVGERIGHTLVDMAAQAGQAIVQFVGDTIDKAGDFESGMNRFASVTGDSLEESGQSLEEFKDLFISLGRELPVSTAEVQQAAIEMAKGGIEPATIAAGGLRDVLNLAAAGEVGIAEAAEIASKQLGVWVDQAADAQTKAAFLKESVDLLSQAANASTVNVDDGEYRQVGRYCGVVLP
jgi:phage tail tape-measure protein